MVVGIGDNGEITGIDGYTDNVNEILRVPFDFYGPSVLVKTEILECTDKSGKPNHLLVIKIPQSPELHANQQDDVYYRMGCKSQKLSFDDRIVVESPGNLPGIVRLNNMRQVHFSRNPKIAAFLHEYDYVQDFGQSIPSRIL